MEAERGQENLQELIGYKFSDPSLLLKATTRSQYLNDNNDPHIGKDDNMDPLATFGDAVLDLIMIHVQYRQGVRDIGILTDNKIKNIRKSKTRAVAERHAYEKYIRWGQGEYSDKIWTKGDKTFDTCIEALIGAVYLDVFHNKKDLITMNAETCVCSVLTKLGLSLY